MKEQTSVRESYKKALYPEGSSTSEKITTFTTIDGKVCVELQWIGTNLDFSLHALD